MADLTNIARRPAAVPASRLPQKGPARASSVFANGYMPQKTQWVNQGFKDHFLGFVVGGRGTYRANKGPVQNMEPGCVFTVYPGAHFHYGPVGGTWQEYFIGFRGPRLREWIQCGWFPKDGGVYPLTNASEMAERFREIIRIFKRNETGDADRALLMAERMLMEMYHGRVSFRQAQTPSKPLEAVLNYCRSHAAENINFEALAAEHAMSYSTLRQSLRKLVGLAPAHYLFSLRCDAARALLSDTDLSVKEIGARVGLDDAYSFSRMFKRCVGVSPQAYRRQVAPWAGATIQISKLKTQN